MTLYDTHAHLDQLENLDEALVNAKAAGVKGIVAISMNLESSKKILEIKKQRTDVPIYIGMGMHPSDANTDDLDALEDLIRTHASELHAIGEIGLDFWYKWVRKSDEEKNKQRVCYERLLKIAKELDLPAVIHSRGVWRECLTTAQNIGVTRAEFHWYSGPIDVLEDVLKQGYYVSTSPSVAGSLQSRDAMSAAPIEQTLIETDCPVRYKDLNTDEYFVAEPKDVFRTLKAYSLLKGIQENEAANIVNQNAEKFFRLI